MSTSPQGWFDRFKADITVDKKKRKYIYAITGIVAAAVLVWAALKFSSTRYECNQGVCAPSKSGAFATKAQCDAKCGKLGYSCVNHQCLLSHGDGAYASKEECLKAGCAQTYDCIPNLGCTQAAGNTGIYKSELDCSNNCGQKNSYACGNGDCKKATGGYYQPSVVGNFDCASARTDKGWKEGTTPKLIEACMDAAQTLCTSDPACGPARFACMGQALISKNQNTLPADAGGCVEGTWNPKLGTCKDGKCSGGWQYPKGIVDTPWESEAACHKNCNPCSMFKDSQGNMVSESRLDSKGNINQLAFGNIVIQKNGEFTCSCKEGYAGATCNLCNSAEGYGPKFPCCGNKLWSSDFYVGNVIQNGFTSKDKITCAPGYVPDSWDKHSGQGNTGGPVAPPPHDRSERV